MSSHGARRLAFSPLFSASVTTDGRLVVTHDAGADIFDGLPYTRLASQIDGTATARDIVARLSVEIALVDLRAALAVLEAKGYVIDAAAPAAHDGANPAEIIAEGHTQDRSLPFLFVDDYLDPTLLAYAERALAEQQPWLPLKLSGTTPWVGPVIGPPRGPCWPCVVARIRAGRPVHAWLHDHEGGEARSLARSSTVFRDAGHEALARGRALADAFRSAPQGSDSIASLLTIDRSLTTTAHVLLPRPGCATCGQSLPVNARPANASSPQRLLPGDGGWRVRRPDDTFRQYSHHVSPVCGLIRSLQKVETASDRYHVFVAEHASPTGGAAAAAQLPANGLSYGKGLTESQAKTGALCEALERLSGTFRGDEPLRRSTASALGDEQLLLNDCLNFSAMQFAQARRQEASGASRRGVPEPLPADVEIDWTALACLTDGSTRYLPTAYCYYGHPDRRFCTTDSNGTAAGNTLDEATLQGFLETVERDAVAIWWYRKCSRPAVDVTSFDPPLAEALTSAGAELGGAAFVLDLTTDLRVPVFAAISIDDTERVGVGFGAHLDCQIALGRAISELVQGAVARAHRRPSIKLSDDTRGFLLPAPAPPSRRDGFQTFAAGTDASAVAACVRIAGAQGLQVFRLDQTRPDVGLAVAKVVVPGLRAYWRRLGPGRLYTVPDALGWAASPPFEESVNQLDLFA